MNAPAATADPAPGPVRRAWIALLEAIPIIGKPLARLVEAGAWGPIGLVAALAFLLIGYPLALPLMAAWLINHGLLGDWHPAYADQVRRAFRVEELANTVAGQGNRRLDYFQVIEVARSANLTQAITFSVQRHQRIILRKEEIDFKSSAPTKCPVPLDVARPNQEVLSVRVGKSELGTFHYGSREEVIELNQSLWAALDRETVDGRMTLLLTPVKRLQEYTCAELVVPLRLTIEVYKDLVSAQTPAAARGPAV